MDKKNRIRQGGKSYIQAIKQSIALLEFIDEKKEERGKEIEVLKRFIKGKRVEEDEMPIVRKYESIGVIHVGFSFKKQETQAKLTKDGMRILDMPLYESV